MSPAAAPCPGCGSVAASSGAAPPPTLDASAGCWARYGQLLARSYADPHRRGVHQLVVDSYVAQHPVAGGEPKHVRQLALCLMTLQLFVEEGHDVAHGPHLHKRMVANLPPMRALDPPGDRGATTVLDVLAAEDATDHHRLVRAWAREVWQAWDAHHDTVRAWNASALMDP